MTFDEWIDSVAKEIEEKFAIPHTDYESPGWSASATVVKELYRKSIDWRDKDEEF